jgi:hypothetical protein
MKEDSDWLDRFHPYQWDESLISGTVVDNYWAVVRIRHDLGVVNSVESKLSRAHLIRTIQHCGVIHMLVDIIVNCWVGLVSVQHSFLAVIPSMLIPADEKSDSPEPTVTITTDIINGRQKRHQSLHQKSTIPIGSQDYEWLILGSKDYRVQ